MLLFWYVHLKPVGWNFFDGGWKDISGLIGEIWVWNLIPNINWGLDFVIGIVNGVNLP